MDQEQIEKKIEWLEAERRSDKQAITTLQKRIAELEGMLDKFNSFSQELSGEVTRQSVRITKMDQYDEALSLLRTEVKKELDGQERRAKSREKYTKQKSEDDLTALNTSLAELRKDFEEIRTLRKEILDNREDDVHRDKLIEELEKKISVNAEANRNNQQSLRLLEEDRLLDKKRFTDIQGELAALRKRTDEQSGKFDLVNESQKKIDTRLNTLMAAEEERREAQTAFLEKISRAQLEAEKTMKEWTKRFETIDERAATLTQALQSYGEIERSLRKAQQDFETITEQISRRIHEITEMQRLGEERFRQEWTTFKADDQKRWMNYSLTQEEQTKESNRRFERLVDRVTTLEEVAQDLRDAVQHSNEEFESLMQGLLGVFREWLATNERYSDSLG